MSRQQTIVALATPPGRSGIGVIRLSGPEAAAIAGRLSSGEKFDLVPRHATLRTLTDLETREPIDEAIITWFKAPNSFTGEDVIEISCHGSPVLLRVVIDACLALGARLADPGEFSLRALANGKMDLAETEAIRDLINAQTAASARLAVRQLRGEFSNELQPVKDELLDVIVLLESALEFVEDDLPGTQAASTIAKLAEIADRIITIAGTFRSGKLIREGLKVALVGRPNVGKSSIFNVLLGSERAIVTDIAGTTRDQIRESFTIDNIPVSLIDTAGLRETTDVVESIGVERSRMTMADADLVIALFDASEEFANEDREILRSLDGLNFLAAINKTDLVTAGDLEKFVSSVAAEISAMSDVLERRIVSVSAKTGEGINELSRSIVQPFEPEGFSNSGFLVTDARHFDLLVRAVEEIDSSNELLKNGTSEEIVLVGLHNALRYLGQITGETTTEDMLTRIFSTFCIGK